MSVKTIFKVLIMTVVMIVISSLTIEMININTTGVQINQISKIAVRQACSFFGQETYKRETNSISNMSDILGTSDTTAVSGILYGDKSANEIYDDLYKNSDSFKFWAKNYVGTWENLDFILLGMLIPTNLELTSENYYISKSYYDNKMTPLNLGISYLDKDTVERIMQWNMTKIFSNGKDGKDGMVVDTDGDRIYVKYKGFRIYTTEAEITNISYRVINIVTERDKFMKLTNIDSARLGIEDSSDERAEVCIAGIEYSVPIAYEGLTPFRKIMQFAWSNEVEGYKGKANTTSASLPSIYEATLNAGGFEGDSSLPVPGDVIFYIIR